MPQYVEIPDIGLVEFPDDASLDEITRESNRLDLGRQMDTARATPPATMGGLMGSEIKERAGLFPKSAAQLGTSALRTLGTVLEQGSEGALASEGFIDEAAQLRQRPAAEKLASLEANPLVQGANRMDAGLDRAFPEPEGGRDFGHNVVSGLGQMVPMLAGGLGARALGAGIGGATKLAMLAGSGMEFDDAFKRSIERGDDRDTAFKKALGYTMVAGGIENKLGAGKVLRQLFANPAQAAQKLTALGVSKNMINAVLSGAVEEGSQRAAQDLIVDQQLDPKGIWDEASVGGVVQGAVSIPGAAGWRGLSQPQPPQQAQQTQQTQTVPDPANAAQRLTQEAQPAIAGFNADQQKKRSAVNSQPVPDDVLAQIAGELEGGQGVSDDVRQAQLKQDAQQFADEFYAELDIDPTVTPSKSSDPVSGLRSIGVSQENATALINGTKTPEQVVSEMLGISNVGGRLDAKTMLVEERPDGARDIGFSPEAGPASVTPKFAGQMSHEDAIRLAADQGISQINQILGNQPAPPKGGEGYVDAVGKRLAHELNLGNITLEQANKQLERAKAGEGEPSRLLNPQSSTAPKAPAPAAPEYTTEQALRDLPGVLADLKAALLKNQISPTAAPASEQVSPMGPAPAAVPNTPANPTAGAFPVPSQGGLNAPVAVPEVRQPVQSQQAVKPPQPPQGQNVSRIESPGRDPGQPGRIETPQPAIQGVPAGRSDVGGQSSGAQVPAATPGQTAPKPAPAGLTAEEQAAEQAALEAGQEANEPDTAPEPEMEVVTPATVEAATLAKLEKSGRGESKQAERLRAKIGKQAKAKQRTVSTRQKIPGPKRAFGIQPRVDGVMDILDAVDALGGVKPPNGAPEYDGVESAQWGEAKAIFRSAAAHRPDTLIQELGTIGFKVESTSDLWEAIDRAIQQRRGLRETGGDKLQVEERFWDAIQPENKSGLQSVPVETFEKGDKFKLRGKGISEEEVKVTHVDRETGEVTVKDGPKIGQQTIPPDTNVWVRKGTLEKDSATPSKPAFQLAEPESVEQQKAREEKEQAERKAKADRQAMLDKQAKPLIGSTGDIGQGDMLGGGDLLSSVEGDASVSQLPAAEAQKVIDEWQSEHPEFTVATVNRPGMTSTGTDGRKRAVRGWFSDGVITVNTAAIQSAEELTAVLRHERAHGLLRSAEGMAVLDRAIRDRLGENGMGMLRKKYAQRKGETAQAYDRRLREEWLVRIAEKDTPVWRRIVEAVKRWLASKGLARLTDDEVGRAMLASLDAKQDVGFDSIRLSDRESLGAELPDGAQQTDSEAFKRWFGKSKAVDLNGNPLVVYHGTASVVTKFSRKFAGAATQASSAKEGFFFTDDPGTADSYAQHATSAQVDALLRQADEAEKRGDWGTHDAKAREAEDLALGDRARGQNILPVYLKIENPYEIDAKGENYNGIEGGITEKIKAAKRRGQDGVIIYNLDDAVGLPNRVATHYVVFSPQQIKSASGNRGAFDPGDSDIRHSLADEYLPSEAESRPDPEQEPTGQVQPDERAPDSLLRDVYSATEDKSASFGQWWDKVKFHLRKLASPVPEIPLTGEMSERAAPLLRLARLYSVETNRVRREAAERVGRVVDSLASLRTREQNNALAQYYKLGERARKLREKQQWQAADAAEAQMAKLEKNVLEKDPFNLFRRMVIMRDLWWRGANLKNDGGNPITLPAGLTVEQCKQEGLRLKELITAHPAKDAINKALKGHYKLVKELQDSIIDHGEVIPEALRNPAYFPHHLIDGWNPRPDGVKPNTEEDFRRYLIAPVGSGKLIQADYLKAMYVHTAEVLAHNAKVDLIERYAKPYDISEKLKATHKKNWDRPQNIPDGHRFFAPYRKLPLRMDYILSREVLAAKLGEVWNDGDLRKRLDEAGGVLDITADDLQQALVAGEKIRWVLPNEIADALDGIAARDAARRNPDTGHALGLPARVMVGFWKRVKLFAPWNWIRYEYGNLTTDVVDKVLVADPGAAKYWARAAREIIDAGKKGSTPTKEWVAAANEGVFDTITASEVGELDKIPGFKEWLTTKQAAVDAGRKILGATTRASAFRESTFRYAKFLADVERMRAGKEPIYAGAYHGDVEAVGEIKHAVGGSEKVLQGDELLYAKAAEISLKTYGDYNSISVIGQWLRRYAVPFHSWTDVNFKYHANQIRNIADGLKLGKAGSGKALAKYTAARSASLSYSAVRVLGALTAVSIAQEMWNQIGGPMLGLWKDDDDLESSLSPADRRRPHLLFGRDKNGKALVVYTPSAFGDIIEWAGGNNLKRLAMDYFKGDATLGQVIADYAKTVPQDVLNKLVQSLGPTIKTPYELASGKAVFPDVTNQRNVAKSDQWWRLAGGLTDDRVVNAARSYLDKDYYGQPVGEQMQQIVLQVRRRDPEQWSYYEARERAADWKEATTGKRFESGDYQSPDAQVLRNFRRAIYRGDVDNAERFYKRLLEMGYTSERLDASIRAQHPLSDLSKEQKVTYQAQLKPVEKRELEQALKYYGRIESMDHRERALFPRARQVKAGMKPQANTEALREIVGRNAGL